VATSIGSCLASSRLLDNTLEPESAEAALAAQHQRLSAGRIVIALGEHPEEQLVAFAREWFGLVARAEWGAALRMIDEPSSYGIRWTREAIIELVRDVFGPETRFAAAFGSPVFSGPDLATGNPHPRVGAFDAGGFWLHYDVPLNGAFSDLTAQFEFMPRGDRFAAILHDMHVL